MSVIELVDRDVEAKKIDIKKKPEKLPESVESQKPTPVDKKK